MSPDRLIGLAYVAERFHSGQFSKGYELLSKIGWSPRTDNAAKLLPQDEWTDARCWAAHYVRLARHNPKLF